MKVDSPRSPLLIATIQLGLLLFVIYYTFIGGQTAQGIYDHQWRLITLWLTSLLIGIWLLWRLVGKAKIPRTPFDLPLLFLLIAWSLATLFSISPGYSRETLVFFIIYLFFFYLAADLGRWPWLVELTFNAVIAVSGLVWTLALWQLAHWYQNLAPIPELLRPGYEFTRSIPRLSVLGNPNTMASYLALVIPITLYKLTTVRRLMSRVLLILWVVMLLGAIFLTGSRGGILGFVCAGGFFMLLWAFQRSGSILSGMEDKRMAIKAGRGMWLLALGLVAGLVLLGGLIFIQRGVQAGVGVRQQVGAGAVKTLARHSVFGSGPGTLGQALIQYQKPLDMIWADAHNLILTLVAETGLIGGIGLVWLGLVAFRRLWFTFRQTDRTEWRMRSLACAAALVGFIIHNMVDSLFKFPLIMVLVAIWAGFWISAYLPAPRKKQAGQVWGYPVMAMAVVILAVNTFTGLREIENIAAYNQAVEAAGRGDWRAALDHLRLADRLAPEMAFYQRQIGVVSGYLSAEADSYRPEAVSHYQAAFRQVDQLAIDHANLGCLLWADNQQATALEEMGLAYELQPGHLLYRLNLGHYLENAGDEKAAVDQYAQIVAARPDYLQSTYWNQTKWRAGTLPEISGEAAQILAASDTVEARRKLIELHLYAGEVETAWQTYEAHREEKGFEPSLSALARGKILLARGRPAEAKEAFQKAVGVDPGVSEAYLYLSKIALVQADLNEAAQNIQAALFLSADPNVLYQAGLVAEAKGEEVRAIAYFEEAFALLTSQVEPNLARYATEVARRRPLPISYLPCLLQIYPSQLLIEITLSEGELLEAQGNYVKAGQVYRRLLKYEPGASAVEAKLEVLCQEHMEGCDFRAN